MEIRQGYSYHMKEELLAYALLLYEGFPLEKEYQKFLDDAFVKNPVDDDLLELEFMSSNLKESIIYIRTHFNYNNFDHEIFGRMLMQTIKAYYDTVELKEFAERMYLLWESLPGNIQKEDPFFILSYADEPLSWGDEKQTRELYEHMLAYYN